MAKAVLISIRPEWVEKIANEIKTVEVRKTKPYLETPFKCYIYCTNTRPFLVWGDVFRGDWFTEFTRLSGYGRAEADKTWDVFNGHVVGEFVCDKITWLTHIGFSGLPGIRLAAMKNGHTIDDSFDFSKSCLTTPQIEKYLGGKDGYAWHISNLKIYDAPKKLGEFWRDCLEYSELSTNCWSCENVCGDGDETDCNTDGRLYLHRPPQSWCYVEELE